MTSDHDMLWRHCAHLGRVLLPLMDQDPWRQARRHEDLQARGMDTTVSERLTEVCAALAAHAVVTGTSLSAAGLDALPLHAVREAVNEKCDVELLAGLPDSFADSRDELAVKLYRLCSYLVTGRPQRTHLWLAWSRGMVNHALVILTERSRATSPTCGDLFHWAAEAGLPR